VPAKRGARIGVVRILTVANHVGARGGLERTQLTNCAGLAARGHRVDLAYVSPGDFTEQWARFAGTMLQITGSLPRRHHLLASTRGLLDAIRAGRRLRPQVLYVYRYWDVPYAVAVGALVGAPVVFHLCLPPPAVVPRWLSASLARVSATLAVSRDTAGRWEDTGLPSAGMQVVLTGVDLERYAPAADAQRSATRQAMGVGDDEIVVLYAGRIDREKGVDVVVRAFALFASGHPGSRLVVVGSASLGADPADSARYQQELRVAAGGLPVTWLAARRDVVPLIQAADVAVAPSLWPEPLSRSVMEPLACGVPVIATRVGGNPEILTGWLSRYLVEPGDADGLAHQLCALSRWRRQDPGLGARLRAEAEARLSLDAELDAIERAMVDAARSRHPVRRRRRASATEDTSWG
jgi:glycosyltransferase involved in cell wall biosynthesis